MAKNKKLNVMAANLGREMSDLLAKFQQFQVVHANLSQLPIEERNELSEIVQNFANVYKSLPDLFVDAHRDDKDQSYAIEIDMWGRASGK